MDASRAGVGATVLAALIAAWALLSGKKISAPAETQEQINEGFTSFMNEARGKIASLETEAAGLRSYIRLLIGLMRKAGLDIPSPDIIQDGFLLLPPDKVTQTPPSV